MCQKCGCNKCETVRGPLLTEGKVKKLISENLSYHIDNNISLMENVFRIGSDAHLSMIKEARKLYSRGVLDLCEEDEALMETNLGEFDLYENQIIPLDLPMIREATEYKGRKLSHEEEDRLDLIAHKEFDCDFKDCSDENKSKIWNKRDLVGVKESKYEKEETIQQTIDRLKARIDDSNDGGNVPFLLQKIKDLEKSLEEAYSGFRRGEPEDPDSEPFNPTGSVAEFKEDLRALFGKFKGDLKNPEFIKGVAQIMVNWKSLLRSQLDEAKKKKKKEKKDPPIGKPKRGGSKAYYVYVRDPKTKKVKKVSFGSGGLRAKIRNPKARKAFAARHKCSQKTDRTKPSYWSCRLPRYASQLGLGANMNTFW